MTCAQFFQTYGAMIQTIALVATLIVIIFYTIFTNQLKKATVRQTELSLRPCITIYRAGGRLFLENIGRSPALNIRIEPVEIFDFCKVSFPKVSLVKVDEKEDIEQEFNIEMIDKESEVIRKIMEGDQYLDFPFFPIEIAKREDYFITVHYENIIKETYYSKIKVNLIDKKHEFVETDKTKK